MNISLKPKSRPLFWTLLLISLSSSGSAAEEELLENSQWPHDSWKLVYEYDDFSDEIYRARIIYAPKDFSQQKAFLIRCQPYYTNFSTAFLEEKNNLMENGKLHNDSAKFAKHGFIYDQKREIEFEVDGRSDSHEVSVGGQIRTLSKWLPLDETFKQQNKDKVSMSWHTSMVYKEIPSFTSLSNTDLSRDLFAALKTGIQKSQTIHFQLDMPNSIEHQYSLDLARLKAFAPPEVLDYCLLKRELRDD